MTRCQHLKKIALQMKQEIQHIQSRKEKPLPQIINTAQEKRESKYRTLYYFPPSDAPNVKTKYVMCSTITNDETYMG